MKRRCLVSLVALCLALGCSAGAGRGKPAAGPEDRLAGGSQSKAQEGRQAVPEPVEVIKGLRSKFLSLKPGEVGPEASGAGSGAYGVMMEMGFREALASLVSLSSGDASLYLGHGGGVIGGGGREGVRRAALAFVAESSKHLSRMKVTKEFPYPAVGRVTFYVLTRDGVFTAEAGEEELAEQKHPLSPLFYAGNDVLTQLRLTTEKQQ